MLDQRASTPSSHGIAQATADAALPAAAQALLARLLRDSVARLEAVLATTLDQLEKHLFVQAETGPCALQQPAFDAMRQLRRYRADLLPTYLSVLQQGVGSAVTDRATTDAPTTAIPADAWALLDNAVVEDTGLIDALAARLEARLHLPLHLLGHRMAALLERDAMQAKQLPIGPQALLRGLFDASVCLDLAPAARRTLLRQFERCLAPMLDDLYAGANACLADAGILPELQGYRSTPRGVAEPAPERPSAPMVGAPSEAARPHHSGGIELADEAQSASAAGRGGSTAAEAEVANPQRTNASDDELFDVMRGLLGSRRALLGRFAAGDNTTSIRPVHAVSPAQVHDVLRELQRRSPDELQPARAFDPQPAAGLKPLLLAQLQASAPPQHRAELPPAQCDVVELLDMLFEHLLRDAPARGAVAGLLARLQVPLLRVALDDRGFFTRNQHPARRLLDLLADAGLYWHDESDADEDFGAGLHALIEHIANDFDGDLCVFEVASEQLRQQLATRMRKAALAERRHVDAERGRERLEHARIAAAEAVRGAIGDRPLPRVVHSLLSRAWTDVLALSVLRGSDGERQFARQMDVARWLVAHGGRTSAAPACTDADATVGHLQQELSLGLCQVGYHHDDAQALARAMFAPADVRPDAGIEPCGSGEGLLQPAAQAGMPEVETVQSPDALASMQAGVADGPRPVAIEETLATHQRFGMDCADVSLDTDTQAQTGTAGAALDAAMHRQLDQLRRLPFGTWFDLAGDDGRRQRCRMSWFSPVTGRCLFVNHRGQRAGDHTLAWLAAEMEQGRARIVREAQASVVDSAWQAILGVLRSFAPKSSDLAVA